MSSHYLKKTARQILRSFGYDVKRVGATKVSLSTNFPEITRDEISTLDLCRSYTKTGDERLFALIRACKYVLKAGIPGAFVECGVWKGGSVMAMAETMIESDERERDIYLFDTFEGMPRPTEEDVDYTGKKASETFDEKKIDEDSSNWGNVSLEVVKANLNLVTYPIHLLHFVKGKVENTIPKSAPDQIAFLRLDTDFYTSTKHELEHLFPRLAKGGVLIIDDYGHYMGARKAVDEYLAENHVHILLNRIDYSGRIGVRT